MKIPWNTLPGETLDLLLEEIVTRDGTDYGQSEKTTLQKVTRARNQLTGGLAELHWDSVSETASLLSLDEVTKLAGTRSE